MSDSIVVPGQIITAEGGYLRGHGTYIQNGNDGEPMLVACVAGTVERVNKLLSVRPTKSRYIGEVGDLVVGRITEVAAKRWKVDVGAHKDASLQLSSVNLPGGAQRIRTAEDQLQMRTFYQEHDLISAEVQQVNQDGSVHLHTRSQKYGKLENGQLLIVPQVLIRRLKQHFVTLPHPCGVDMILGTNGNIWITRTMPSEWTATLDATGQGMDESGSSLTPQAEELQRLRRLHADTPLSPEERERVCRVRNAVAALASAFALITPDVITAVVKWSIDMNLAAKDMLRPDTVITMVESALSKD